MLNAKMKSTVLDRAMTRMTEQMTRLRNRIAQIEKVEAAGFDLVNSWWGVDGGYFTIKREELGKLRKIVGRLEVTSKNVTGDFDTSNELNVTVRPMSDEFKALEFIYRTKFRNGGKCHVVEQSSTYKSLVCQR